MEPVVVASFNIRTAWGLDGSNAWPFRRRATAATAGALGADVLGLQEAYACPARYLARRLPGSERHGSGRNAGGGGERCTVLVRSARFEVRSATTRWYGATPERPGTRLGAARFPRIATVLRLLDRADGREVQFANTHLDEEGTTERHRQSIVQLLSWLDPSLPTVIVGDFNTERAREPDAFAPLTDAGFVAALPPDAPGTFHDFRGGTGGERIDHIYVSRRWEVLDAGVVVGPPGARLPSDHWPVRATLRLPPDDQS